MTEGGRPDQNPVPERSHRTLKYQFLNCRTRDLQFIVERIRQDINSKIEPLKNERLLLFFFHEILKNSQSPLMKNEISRGCF